MPRLTKRERKAIRTALASWGADDHDEQDWDGFDPEDVDSALAKMQERDDGWQPSDPVWPPVPS